MAKQASEMSDEELANYKEPGAEEGDWMDYMPTGLFKGGAKTAGKFAIRKASQGMLDRVKQGAKDKIAAQGKTGTGNAASINYKQQQGGGQDYLADPTVTQRSPAPAIKNSLAGDSSPSLSNMPMPAAALPPIGDTVAAAVSPAKKGTIRKRAPEANAPLDESAMPPEDISGGY